MKIVSVLARAAVVGALALSFGAPCARAQVADVGNSAIGDGDETNGVPVITGVDLPEVVRTNDTLEVSVQASDPDGDELETVCEWRRNGEVIAGESGTTLDLSRPGYGDKGDTISVVVSVGDGLGGLAMAPEVSVTVADTLPSIERLAIDNQSPRTNDLLTAQCSASDADGDAFTTTYQWTKNGKALAGATGATLDLSKAGNGDKHDMVSVVATVSTFEGVVTREAENITVLNTPPTPGDNPVISTWQNRAVMGRPDASDADGDTLRFTATKTAAVGGALGGIAPSDGLFLFRPNSVVGTATLTIQISDGEDTTPLTLLIAVEAAPAKGTQIYTALGDSTALGRGASYGQGYSSRIVGLLQKADGTSGKGWRLSVRAVRNFSAPDLLRVVGGQSMLSLAVADNPTALTLWIGLNDVNSIAGYKAPRETWDQFSAAYGTLISTLSTRTKARVAVADVPNLAQLPYVKSASVSVLQALSRASVEMQRRINLAVQGTSFARVVLLNDPGTKANFASGDGFHPSSMGYALVTTKMFAALLRVLEFAPELNAVVPTNVIDLVGKKRAFQVVASDANGASTLSQIEFLLNTRIDAATGAYLLYSPQTRQLSLRAGRVWLGPIRTGPSAKANEILDNGVVRIVGRDVVTQLGADGTMLSVVIPLTSTAKLVGANTIFVRVKDATGRTPLRALPIDGGYVRAGTYTVLPLKGR